MKKIFFALPIVVSLLAVGCKQKESPQTETPQVVFEGFTDTVELELVPVEEPKNKPAESYFDKKAKAASATAAKPVDRNKGKAETLYVEADDSHGRVWGHVTMRGDRGTGTVHDENENTWAVAVTRHGNELYAVDQNSRQYVFKLK